MPGTLARFGGTTARGRYNAATALTLAKKIMQLKKEFSKGKPKQPSKPRQPEKKRKPRSDKGKKRKPRDRAPNRGVARNVTSGAHTYSSVKHKPTTSRMLAKKFPQLLYQTYYITSPETYTDLNPGVDGTITNPDMLYSVPSVLWTNSSIHLFNVHNTETHWRPIDPRGEVPGYRTGTQLTGLPSDTQLGTISTTPNESFIFVNDPTNVRLTSVQCPFKQNGLAENATGSYAETVTPVYTTPNTSLNSLHINLMVGNPTIQDEMITLKVIRYNNGDETLRPGTLGADNAERTALTQTMCNSGKFTNPQQFSTLYSKRFRMTGLRTGQKMRYYKIKKSLPLNFLRSQYRKSYNANNLTTIGLDAQPSFVLSDDGTFFNSVFIILQSNCIDNEYVANVSVETGTGSPEYLEHLPQIATYPPIGIPDTELGGKYKPVATGAQHSVSGTITVSHRVQAKRRAIGSSTNEALFALQAQLTELKLAKPPKTPKFKMIEDGSESDSDTTGCLE
ncbi:MAG: putative capsid protein [Cressdnaviricota sp.]|nr:MAG: putative capsid protein [Cressdnaviricota sp.]